MPRIPQFDGRLPELHQQSWQVLGTVGQGYPLHNAQRHIVCGLVSSVLPTTLTAAANTIIAIPFVIGVGGILELISGNVTTLQASQNYRLGIYTNKEVGCDYPDRLLFDTGSISTGSTGVTSTTCNVPIEPNQLYWAVHTCSSATAVFRALAVGGAYPILGIDSAMNATTVGIGWSASATYGALPMNFPSGASVQTANAPAIGLQMNYQAR